MLGKTFGHEWHFTKLNEEKGEELAEFLKNHSHCCDDLDAETCGGVSPYDDARFEPFELTYESQEDFGKKKSFQQIMDYKEKSALGWEMANFLHKNEKFKTELADNIFFGMKVGREITADDVQGMFDDFGFTDLSFTAADLVRYLNRKNRIAKLIEECS